MTMTDQPTQPMNEGASQAAIRVEKLTMAIPPLFSS